MTQSSLDGRVAVVTGGARGIGDAIVRTLCEAGAKAFALDRIEPVEARPNVRYLDTDITDPANVAASFATIEREAGRIDVLVNNAGIQRVGMIGTISFADWSAVLATHLNGFFLCASEAVPRMIAGKRGGAIVSIASVAALVGMPGRGPYCAAKAGMVSLTRTLALEVAPSGIRVNAVAPGLIATEFHANAGAPERLERLRSTVPMLRDGSAEEVADAILWLLSDQSSYITGAVIPVTGGR